MENSIYTGLSRQMALGEKMDIIANNIANMSTPGYRGQNMLFKEFINHPPASEGKEDPSDPLSMVEDFGQYQNTENGPLQHTGNPLDAAIQGPGWFGVQTANGIRYTRAGDFTLDSTGNIITSSGDKVASTSGGTLTVPAGAKEISITHDGQIFTDKGQVGSLMVVGFANDQDVKPEGDGLYNTTDQPDNTIKPQVMEGMLEGSNVKPVLEMTRMIEVARAYESTQQMILNEHNRQRAMIEQLTQITGSGA